MAEIPALLRASMTIICPVVEKNPKIIEATYNCGSRGLVTQHSIEDLACALANGSQPDQPAGLSLHTPAGSTTSVAGISIEFTSAQSGAKSL